MECLSSIQLGDLSACSPTAWPTRVTNSEPSQGELGVGPKPHFSPSEEELCGTGPAFGLEPFLLAPHLSGPSGTEPVNPVEGQQGLLTPESTIWLEANVRIEATKFTAI